MAAETFKVGDIVRHRASGKRGVVVRVLTGCTNPAHLGKQVHLKKPDCTRDVTGYQVATGMGVRKNVVPEEVAGEPPPGELTTRVAVRQGGEGDRFVGKTAGEAAEEAEAKCVYGGGTIHGAINLPPANRAEGREAMAYVKSVYPLAEIKAVSHAYGTPTRWGIFVILNGDPVATSDDAWDAWIRAAGRVEEMQARDAKARVVAKWPDAHAMNEPQGWVIYREDGRIVAGPRTTNWGAWVAAAACL